MCDFIEIQTQHQPLPASSPGSRRGQDGGACRETGPHLACRTQHNTQESGEDCARQRAAKCHCHQWRWGLLLMYSYSDADAGWMMLTSWACWLCWISRGKCLGGLRSSPWQWSSGKANTWWQNTVFTTTGYHWGAAAWMCWHHQENPAVIPVKMGKLDLGLVDFLKCAVANKEKVLLTAILPKYMTGNIGSSLPFL